MKQTTLKKRLLLSYAGILGIILLIYGGMVMWTLDYSFRRSLRSSLESVAVDIRYDILYEDISKEPIIDTEKEFAFSPVYIEVWRISGSEKKLIQHSKNMRGRHLPMSLSSGGTFDIISLPAFSKHDKTALYLLRIDDGRSKYIVTAATTVNYMQSTIGSFFVFFIFLGIALYLISIYIENRIIERVLGPMKNIARTASSISKNNLSSRVGLPAVNDEFYRLAETFNGMLARLEEDFHRVRRFNVNVSHELKTPLTIIKGESEVALTRSRSCDEYRQALESILEEVVSMESITESMLLLSRDDSDSLKSRFTSVNLGKIVRKALNKTAARFPEAEFSIDYQVDEEISVNGIEELLSRAAENLIDNAFKYSFKNSDPRISVKVYEIEDSAVLEIVNYGVSIDEKDLPHLLESFYRAESSRNKSIPGYGLGLSIVQWIAQLHDARVVVENKEDGVGARLVFQKKD